MLIKGVRSCFRLLTSRQKRDYWIVLIVMSLSAIMELAGIAIVIPLISILIDYDNSVGRGVVKYLHEYMSQPEKKEFLFFLMVIGVVLVWVSGILTILSGYFNQRYLKRINAYLSVKVYRKLMLESLAEFYGRSSSEFARNVNGVSERISIGVIGVSILILSRVCQVAVVIAILLYINITVTAILVSVISVSYIIIYYVVRRRVEKLSSGNFSEGKEIQQKIIGSYRGFRTIIFDELLYDFLDKFYIMKSRTSKRAADIAIMGAMPKNMIEAVGISSLLMVSYWMGVNVTNNSSFVTTMGLLGVAAYRVLPSAQQIYHGVNQLTASLAVYNSVKANWVFGASDRFQPSDSFGVSDLEVVDLVDVTYAMGDRTVFSKLSLKIPLNSGVVRICGESGVGKSTLIELVLGLRKPSSGSVRINNIPIENIDSRSLWRRISYVVQDGYLFEGSVQDNIVLSSEKVDLERLALVADICGLDCLGSGAVFDHSAKVSENGQNFSGGQVNRLLVARGIYKDTDVVFLDEAFASLDVESAKNIILKVKFHFPCRCFVIVSHRDQELDGINNIVEVELSSVAGF